jgi:hypothetical protein
MTLANSLLDITELLERLTFIVIMRGLIDDPVCMQYGTSSFFATTKLTDERPL